MRLLVSRALVVLGGVAAATAVSWAVSAGTAAAEAVLGGDAAIENLGADALRQATRAIENVTGSASSDLTDAASLESVGAAVGGLTEHSVRAQMTASSSPCSEAPLDCAGELVDHGAIGQLTGSSGIGDTSTDDLTGVVLPIGPHLVPPTRSPTTVNGVASPLRSEAPRSGQDERTTSGPIDTPDGTGDAPVHSPASVPLTMPVSPAGGGGVTGSSMGLIATAASMDQLLPDTKFSRVVHPKNMGRPNSLNPQPGVAPD